MKLYRMTAQLLSPLVVRKERQSQRSDPVSSLPGTLVRGALAQLYLSRHGEADDQFRELFLDEEAYRFGPLDPGSNIFPLSAATCKREKLNHGLTDLLWLRIARRLLGKELPESARRRGMLCSCTQELKSADGFWSLQGSKVVEEKGPRRGVDAHVGIDRFTHSAHESILYFLPTAETRTEKGKTSTLTGILEAKEDVQPLQKLLENEGGEIRIGHARTRGYGRVALQIHEAEPEPTNDPEAWSQKLIEFLSAVSPDLRTFDPARHFFFGITMPTGAILFDEILRSTPDPAGMVPWLPPLPAADSTKPVLEHAPTYFADGKLWCVSAAIKQERLRGWNAAHGLPRQDDWMVSRGGVYAYLYEGGELGREELKKKLIALQQSGLGVRRNEGFGRVRISDDFHHQHAAGKERT